MKSYAPGLVRPGAFPWEVMQARLGVREISPNRGPWIDECLRFVGWDPDERGGAPWCAASFVWCCHQAGVKLHRTPSVRRLAESVEHRRLIAPQMGCGIIHLKPGGVRGHVLFYLGVSSTGVLQTLSGNTSGDGSRDGDRVAFADHTWDYVRKNGGFFFHLKPEPEREEVTS